jgi:hypothetical protein
LRPLYLLAAASVVVAVMLVCSQLRTPWLAVALSLPLVPALTDPSCYYYCLWVLLAVLARARPAVAVMLCGVAAGGQLLSSRLTAYDARYAALALLYVVSAAAALGIFADGPYARWRSLLARRFPARNFESPLTAWRLK